MNKLIIYGGSIVMFLMYWGMFAAFTNWWLGLIMAGTILGLQTWVKRSVKIQMEK